MDAKYRELRDEKSDEEILKMQGYDQELKRGLASTMNFAFGFTEVSVFASLVGSMGIALAAGGPAMLLWGWIVGSVFTIVVGFSMAEICSAYPSAGSVYHWAGQLTSEEWSAFWAYVTGWLNFLGNAAGDASFASAWAYLFSASLVASGGEHLDYQQIAGLSIAAVFMWSILNFFEIDRLGWLNNFAALLQVGSLFGIGIAVLACAPSLNDASFVFTETFNSTGFTSPGMVICIGLLSTLFSFSGYEASAHMAEETHDAANSAPRGLIYTCIATAIGGLVFIVPMLIAMPPVALVLSTPFGTDVASVEIFLITCGQTGGAVMAWLSVLNLFFSGMSSVAVTSRITFALIRDGGFPCSEFLSGVSYISKSPVKAIMLCFLFDAAILLLPLTEPTNGQLAFNSIIGLTVIGFQLSYGIPILLRITAGYSTFVPADISLGRFWLPCGVLSCLWLFGTSIILFFPQSYPVTQETMNYVCVVFGVVCFVAGVNWLVSARKTFRGPRRAARRAIPENF